MKNIDQQFILRNKISLPADIFDAVIFLDR